MPRCVDCKSLLPPEFLSDTFDSLAKKCIFCENGNNKIEYFSQTKNETTSITKQEIIQEYVEFLKELSDSPDIKDAIDAIKNRGEKTLI